MESTNHKVFISYYHKDDQWYKDELLRQNLKYDLFQDYSVHENEIDDTGKSDERIRQIIRDDYIKDSTVLVLLCGKNTKKRKHIDWEIHAAMFNTNNNPKMGILVVSLPGTNNCIRANSNEDKELVAPKSSNWFNIDSRSMYEEKYPSVPSRLIDNFINQVPISVVEWERVNNNPFILKKLIDNAFNRRKTNEYDHSILLRRHNS